MNDSSSADPDPVDATFPTRDISAENPSLAQSGVQTQVDATTAHEIERDVLHRLQNHPGLKFTRLDVHRCNAGAICLEGFLESNDNQVDLCEVVRGIHGITNVLNRVVTSQSTHNVPRKG